MAANLDLNINQLLNSLATFGAAAADQKGASGTSKAIRDAIAAGTGQSTQSPPIIQGKSVLLPYAMTARQRDRLRIGRQLTTDRYTGTRTAIGGKRGKPGTKGGIAKLAIPAILAFMLFKG